MTIYANPSSFSGLGHKAGLPKPYSCNSLNSVCGSDENTPSPDTLSLLSLPSEDEDWQEFGYLLDKGIDSTVPSFKDQSFLRTNSMPSSLNSRGESPQSDFSSLDVEVCSTKSSSHHCCDKCSDGEFSRDEEGEAGEPVAKRTRKNLARKETMREGLDKLSDIPKEDVIYNFLLSSAKKPSNNKKKSSEKVSQHVIWHNVCRPWWHNKLLTSSENSNSESDLTSSSQEKCNKENSEEEQAVRKPKEVGDAFDALCDPRFITLGGSTIQNKDVALKMELDSLSSDPKVLTASGNENHVNEGKEVLNNASSSVPDSKKPPTQPSADVRKTKRSFPAHLGTDDEEQGIKKGKRVRINSKSQSDKLQSPSRKSTATKRQHKVIQDNDADEEDEAEPAAKRCFCGLFATPSDTKKFSLSCDKCKNHYHGKCVGLTEKKAQKLIGWVCAECDNTKRSTEELYCVCRRPYDKRFYVGCDSCEDWFHPECIGTTQQEISQFEEFICPKCRDSQAFTSD